MMAQPPLFEELFALLPLAARVYVRQIEAVVTQFGARVAELQAKLYANSSNSPRLPPTDGPRFNMPRHASPADANVAGRSGTPSILSSSQIGWSEHTQ